MPQYTFQGSDPTVYSDVNGAGFLANPGQTYTLDTAPDALWTVVTPKTSAPATESES